MIRRLLAWLRGSRRDETETDDDGRDASVFVPSPLDRSVRYAHGGNEGVGEEIARVQEQAEELEGGRHDGEP